MPFLISNNDETKKVLFFHIAKTGGSAVRRACSITGLRVIPYGKIHARPDEVGKLPHKSFCFVRPPISWLISYWGFKQLKGWDHKNEVDRSCKTDDLEEWLINIIDHYPGWSTKFQHSVAKDCDYVFRYSQLAEATAWIIEQEVGNTSIAREIQKKLTRNRWNSSENVNHRKICDATIIARLEELEAETTIKFPITFSEIAP
jgi:hypothetical protein